MTPPSASATGHRVAQLGPAASWTYTAALVSEVDSLGAAEARRLAIQDALDSLRSPAERNRLGQFATPPPLAREVVQGALPFLPRRSEPPRVLEPSCGTGSFISALNDFPTMCGAKITGVELDPSFADAAERIWSGRATIVRDDFMSWAARPGAEFDFLVANPPYVRHHHLSGSQKRAYGEITGRATGIVPSGLAGLYVYFVLGAAGRLADGAAASWLIPSEFMSGNYGAALRRYLTGQVSLERVHIFKAEDLQFDDALVTSCVITYTKRLPAPGNEVLLTFG